MTAKPRITRGTATEVITRHIRTEIESGRLAHGEQIPSNAQLAREWGVSVGTINRALNTLVKEGLVIARERSSRIVHYPKTAKRESTSKPRAVLIGGYAGSGKTELGRIIARRTGWPILDKDTTTRAVVEAALERLGMSPHDRESETYLEVVRPAEYAALASTVMENVECGVSVVATAPFIRELNDRAWCDRTRSSIEALGGELHVVWVRCDADSMLHYLRHRGAARDAAKLADWEGYLAGVDLNFTPATEHHVIDNSVGARPLQEQADELVKRIV